MIDSPLPPHYSPFRRVGGGPIVCADFQDGFGADPAWPPAGSRFPGDFTSSEWLAYENLQIAGRADIESSAPHRHVFSRKPKVALWQPPPLISAAPVAVADLQPDHNTMWPGSELRCGVGVADARLCDDPALWRATHSFFSSVIIARPGQFLAGLRRALERHLGGDPRVLLIADTADPAAWAERCHERGVLCEAWPE